MAAPGFLHGRFLLEDDPEMLHVEADLDPSTLAALQASEPELDIVPARDERLGHAHAIALDVNGTIAAGSDPRSDGSAEIIG